MYHPMYHGERFWQLMRAKKQKWQVCGAADKLQILLFLLIKSTPEALSSRG
jgi:hypothetical protein